MLILLEKFDTNPKNQLITRGDFNLCFDSKLDAQGRNLIIKKKSLAKLIELKESYDLCDVWRVRNTNSKRLTFTQHSSGFIHLRSLLYSSLFQEEKAVNSTLTKDQNYIIEIKQQFFNN